MADELDLEDGEPERAEEISAREQRRRRRRESSSSSSSGSSRSKSVDTSVNVREKLQEAFDKVAEQLEIRQDDELATAIKEEAESMAAGLDSLTKTLKPLRYPLVIFVALIMPILAFWRVGGILFRRYMYRRQLRYEAAQQQTEYESSDIPTAEVIT